MKSETMREDVKQALRRVSKGYRADPVIQTQLIEREWIELRKVRGSYVYRITAKGRAALTHAC